MQKQRLLNLWDKSIEPRLQWNASPFSGHTLRKTCLWRKRRSTPGLRFAPLNAGCPITGRRGLNGLARSVRSDANARHLPADVVALIEGMGLKKPRASAAAIHRRISNMAEAQGWPVPSYSTVYAIIADLDPAMVTLAHEGASAFRNRYELIHRHRADTANTIWQADHTMLDLLILDQSGKPARPWLTTVIDDYSRIVAGFMVFFGAPSILNTSLALR